MVRVTDGDFWRLQFSSDERLSKEHHEIQRWSAPHRDEDAVLSGSVSFVCVVTSDRAWAVSEIVEVCE